MPLPYLKPLIRAANHAYIVIREEKEASRIHNLANFAASFAGFIDTSSNKKLALEQLANLEIETIPEEQNKIFAARIEKLAEHSKDGTYFKSLVEILKSCATLVTHPQEGSLIATYSALMPYINQLKATLNNKHVFFQEMDTFFQQIENYRQEVLQDENRKIHALKTANSQKAKQNAFSLEVHHMWKQISLKRELRGKNEQLTQLQQEAGKRQKLLTVTIKQLEEASRLPLPGHKIY